MKKNKTEILYIAIDSDDANFILHELSKKIHENTNVKIDLHHMILQANDYIVNVRPINTAIQILFRHQAEYVVLSEKPFSLKLSQIGNLVEKLRYFRMHTGIAVKEIDADSLLGLLNNNDLMEYCATCKWYFVGKGVCCNGGNTEHRGKSRRLDDSCELWGR